MSFAAAVSLTALHLALATAALLAMSRVPDYTRRERIAQCLLALVVPVIGAVIVAVMAKDAVTPSPSRSESKWDPNDIGSGD